MVFNDEDGEIFVKCVDSYLLLAGIALPHPDMPCVESYGQWYQHV